MDNSLEKQNSIGVILGQAFSVLLHPLLMPTLVFFILFNFCPVAISTTAEMRGLLLRNIFITTFIFPLLCNFVFIYIVKRGFSYEDLVLENHRERFLPFIFTSFFYFAVTYLFLKSNYHPLIVTVMGGISFSVLITALITYFEKISAHSVGIAGVLGIMLVVSYFYPYDLMLYAICAVILLAGILMSIRLYLGAHTPMQVFGGAIIGMMVNILFFILFQIYGGPLFSI